MLLFAWKKIPLHRCTFLSISMLLNRLWLFQKSVWHFLSKWSKISKVQMWKNHYILWNPVLNSEAPETEILRGKCKGFVFSCKNQLELTFMINVYWKLLPNNNDVYMLYRVWVNSMLDYKGKTDDGRRNS